MNASPGTPTVREHGGKRKTKTTLRTVNGTLLAGDQPIEWEEKSLPDGQTAYRGKSRGIEVWLKDGATPESVGSPITGKLEIKSNQVEQGGEQVDHLYVNVLPADGELTATVTVSRPPKVKGKRVLPGDYNADTDYHVVHYGEPACMVRVVESAPAA